jgi:hypothetical protein
MNSESPFIVPGASETAGFVVRLGQRYQYRVFHVYRIQRSSRLLAALILTVGTAWAFLSENGGLIAAIVVFVFGTWLVAITFRTVIILSDDGIELRSVFRKRHLRLEDIKGRRQYSTYGRYGASSNWKIVPNKDGLPMLKIGKGFEFDDLFSGWLNSLPDLD